MIPRLGWVVLFVGVTACDRDGWCDNQSKAEMRWCPNARTCLHTEDGPCPSEAVEEECDDLNDLYDLTEDGQIWRWNDDAQLCEDVS